MTLVCLKFPKKISLASVFYFNFKNTHKEGPIALRSESNLPQAEFSISVGNSKLISMLREATPGDFGESARWTWRADCLLMTPLPHLDWAVLASSQVERHQRVRAHSLDVVHFVLEKLKKKLRRFRVFYIKKYETRQIKAGDDKHLRRTNNNSWCFKCVRSYLLLFESVGNCVHFDIKS